jgi:uncharacterized protein YceH (UPF0502 family)
VDVEPAEIRVLGALIEKQRTTPDAYPLTINALRLACNQSTNRDPVVEYDEGTVRAAAQRLARRGWARFASGHGSRAPKYRQLFGEALGLADDEISVVCVLMLRGAQTPGELKQRTERMHAFADLAAVEATLDRLVERGLVARLARRPGQKEERYAQVLGGDGPAVAGEGVPGAAGEGAPAEEPIAPEPGPPLADGALEERVERLESEVAALRESLDALRRDLGA